MKPHLVNWLNDLRSKSEKAVQSKLQYANTEVPPVKALTDQIGEFLNTLPPAQRNGPWLLSDLTKNLQGKYRDRPHAQNVAIELKKMGWTSKRLWGAEWEGKRIWLKNP